MKYRAIGCLNAKVNFHFQFDRNLLLQTCYNFKVFSLLLDFFMNKHMSAADRESILEGLNDNLSFFLSLK